jgi:hypothetical protein
MRAKENDALGLEFFNETISCLFEGFFRKHKLFKTYKLCRKFYCSDGPMVSHPPLF